MATSTTLTQAQATAAAAAAAAATAAATATTAAAAATVTPRPAVRPRPRWWRPLGTVGATLGVLLLAALPVGMHFGQQAAVAALCDSLARGIGMPVRVAGGVWTTLAPAVVVDRLVIGGGGRPLLTVQRMEIELDLSRLAHPAVRRVRLARPSLQLTERELWSWLASPGGARQAPTRMVRPAAPAAHRVPPTFVVEDGTLDVRFTLRGRAARVHSEGIYFATGRPRTRVVLGPTSLALDGERLVEAAATAVELDSAGRRPRLMRIATLAGALRLPAREGGASLTVHSSTLVARAGGYDLRLKAKPAGRGTGRVLLRSRLDDSLRPVGPEAVIVTLRSADLTRLAAFLEPAGLRVTGTRLTGQLRFGREAAEYRLRTELHAQNVGVDHRLLASGAVGPFDARLRGALRWDPARNVLQVDELAVGTGDLHLELHGRLRADGKRVRLALDLTLPETPCQRVVSSLPRGFAPALQGMVVRGTLGVRSQLRLDSADLESTDVDVSFDPLGCRVTSDAPLADARALRGPTTIAITGAQGNTARWVLGPANHHWVPLPRIASHVRTAFVVAEDSRFFRHRGFDEQQLKRAFVANLREGRLLRGASTISQQLVKNIFLDQRRTLSRKLQEAVLTWRVEQVLSKARILELYLNLVEMGPGVYGVGQAARTYFQRSAGELDAVQAAKLAALTPSPRHLAQRLREDDPGPALLDRIQLLLRLMRRHGNIAAPAAGPEISLRQPR